MYDVDPDTEGHRRVLELEEQIVNLRQAVDSRQRIGVSIGLLASRLDCNPDQAWEFLAWLSQNTNTKARTVAQVLIDLHSHNLDPEDQELADTLLRLLPPGRPVTSPRHPAGDGDLETSATGVVYPIRPVSATPTELAQSMAAAL